MTTESHQPSQAQAPLAADIVAPLDIPKIAEAFRKFEEFKQRLLTEQDYLKTQPRAYIKKAGWRKWALACNVSDRLVSQKRIPAVGKDPENGFYYRIVVEAFHTSTGRTSTGVAIASSKEKARWAHEEHDVYALAHTRAKNRAISDLIGGGEISAEEIEQSSNLIEKPEK
jgi:hypothetical protein